MTTQALLDRLEAVRSRGPGKWSARCPAHIDKNPSLSVRDGERGVLVKCWSGCDLREIMAAVGLRIADLFYDPQARPGHRLIPKPLKLDRVALAFRLELAALDRRLRAERVLTAARNFNGATLTDEMRERLMVAVAYIYQDLERAGVFEHVADTLRARAFHERTRVHAA